MREKDLRKIALESGKTVSRKARSKESTPPMSPGGSAQPSPRGSRMASRAGSDDDSESSDATEWSTNSIDALVASSELDHGPGDAWAAELEEVVNALVDRKRTATEGRERYLGRFNLLLTRHYAQEDIRHKVDQILPVLLKSVKSGQSEREVVLALKGLALIVITEPSETVYDAVESVFKSTIDDSEYPGAKIAAIHALSIATFYGGATVEETEAVMEFFLEIASSDGAVIAEEDNGEIVAASLAEWGLLATQLDDVEDMTGEAMDTFVDQLESSDVGVQIAAGDNIALLYEKSYTEAGSDDEPADSDDERHGKGRRMIKRYTVYRQEHLLQQRLEKLARASSKRVSKKDRKHLHLEFNDILTTIEKPTRGPRYSTALDDDGREYGSRLKVTIHGGGKMFIDSWWKLHRLNGLKRLLQSGFMVHYEHNQVVFDSLPVVVED